MDEVTLGFLDLVCDMFSPVKFAVKGDTQIFDTFTVRYGFSVSHEVFRREFSSSSEDDGH